MFGKSMIITQPVVREHTEYVTKEVHEHRAPTDASVKLLREMELAAQKRIESTVHINDTTFDCVVHIHKVLMDGSTKFMAILSLNGKRITAEYTQHWSDNEPRKVLEAFRDEIARTIANVILQPAIEKAQWPFRKYD